MKLPKQYKNRTHLKSNELLEVLSKEALPNLVEKKEYRINEKPYVWEDIDTYSLLKFLKQSPIQPVGAGVERFYSLNKIEELYNQLSQLTLKEWYEFK